MTEFITVPQQVTQITAYQGNTQLALNGTYPATKAWALTATPIVQVGYEWAVWDISSLWIDDLRTQLSMTPEQLQDFFNAAGQIV